MQTVKIYTEEHLRLFNRAELQDLAGKFSRLLDRDVVPASHKNRLSPWIGAILAAQELWQKRQTPAAPPAPPAAVQPCLFDVSTYVTKSNTIYVEDGDNWPVSTVKTSPAESGVPGVIEKIAADGEKTSADCRWNPAHFGETLHKAEASGQLNLLEWDIVEPPDPDDFFSVSDYLMAWNEWKANQDSNAVASHSPEPDPETEDNSPVELPTDISEDDEAIAITPDMLPDEAPDHDELLATEYLYFRQAIEEAGLNISPQSPAETLGDRSNPIPEKSPAADDDDEPIRFTSKPRRNALSKELPDIGSFAAPARPLPDNQDTESVSGTTAQRLPSKINRKSFAKEPITRAEAAAALGLPIDRICKDPTPIHNCCVVVYLADNGKKVSQFVSYRLFEFWLPSLFREIETCTLEGLPALEKRLTRELTKLGRYYSHDEHELLWKAFRHKETSFQAKKKEAIAV